VFLESSPFCFVGLVSCNLIATGCDADLQIRVSPTSRAIIVGETFIASMELYGCGGEKRLSDTIWWQSADSSVAAVDSASGRVQGRAPGATRVEAQSSYYGARGVVDVVVRASF
jgi:hypothetical protein